jgi:hypothetical protein
VSYLAVSDAAEDAANELRAQSTGGKGAASVKYSGTPSSSSGSGFWASLAKGFTTPAAVSSLNTLAGKPGSQALVPAAPATVLGMPKTVVYVGGAVVGVLALALLLKK